MFYRIRENKIYDYADYEYSKGCLHTDLCTMAEFERNKDNYSFENGQIDLIPNLEAVIIQRRKKQFEKDFFNTSIGNIRRKVQMKDGAIKDFLSDILPAIKTGLELGGEVKIITYATPDFNQELNEEYVISLQEVKNADMNFVQECLLQTVKDFGIQGG